MKTSASEYTFSVGLQVTVQEKDKLLAEVSWYCFGICIWGRKCVVQYRKYCFRCIWVWWLSLAMYLSFFAEYCLFSLVCGCFLKALSNNFLYRGVHFDINNFVRVTLWIRYRQRLFVNFGFFSLHCCSSSINW